MLFWIVVCVVIAVLVVFFFDTVKEHPLGATLLVSSALYFVWRAYTFLMGIRTDDVMIWSILGSTALLMAVVGGVGALVSRRSKRHPPKDTGVRGPEKRE
ncbi:hypothetical protein ASA1KI_01580 [Opitutales bacterium ASA1]|jgi:hypothetical protein|uniref:hypothetical protein n=1 Tax=Congregicoccus parvus TaxID=3081749 RepID=UPI002B3252AF|nr:hypothetical protein ASA1KI_01580 [Opitutales bacterium ASA1]